jgi:hypothetical protein
MVSEFTQRFTLLDRVISGANGNLCPVIIQSANLRHIVEKRQDARKRYVLFALATMRDPLEILHVEY